MKTIEEKTKAVGESCLIKVVWRADKRVERGAWKNAGRRTWTIRSASPN